VTFLPYNPTLLSSSTILRLQTKIGGWFGLLRFRSPLLAQYLLVYFPLGTEMFYFPGCTHYIICRRRHIVVRFPHSEIFGLTVARHLPEAYRSHATSFIAILSQGIHHTLLNFPLGNLKTTPDFLCHLIPLSSCPKNQVFFILLHTMNSSTPKAWSNLIGNGLNFSDRLHSQRNSVCFYFLLPPTFSEKTPNTNVRNS
jgi:hypothetical protein